MWSHMRPTYSVRCSRPSLRSHSRKLLLTRAGFEAWHGVVFVRAGPYVGGVFRFEIHFPPTFLLGSMTPDVVFPPTLLHPLVDVSVQTSRFLRSLLVKLT